jgi:tetratricopeptide (TPR) repeat protein
MKKKDWAWPLTAFVVTLLLHGAIVARHFPAANFLKYQLAARKYNEGKLDRERLVDFSPLYFHLHVAAQKWLPRPDRVILWLQVLLTALAAGLLLLLLRTFFPMLLAATGTAAFILNRSIMVYEHIFEPEILLLFFLLGFLLCCRDSGRSRYFLGGVFLALALLSRLNFLPLALIAVLKIWMERKQSFHWFGEIICFSLPVMAALVLLCLRNYPLLGSASPLAMNPGTVFFEGNNPNSLGQSAIYPPLVYDLADEFPSQPDPQHALYRMVARRDSGKNLNINAVNRFWSGKAMNFIRDHPILFLRLLAVKINFFFHGFRRHDLAVAYWDDQELERTKFPTVPLAWVSALAILGIFLCRREWRPFLLFYGLFFTQMAVMLLTYVSDRQRLAVYPVFIFFACAAVHKIWSWGKRPMQFLAMSAVIGLALLLALKNDAMKEETHQWENFRLARGLYHKALVQRENGAWGAASVSSMQALAAAPWLRDSLRPADLDFGPRGFEGGALAIHETLVAPDFSSLFDRGFLALAAGELEKAQIVFSRLLEEGFRFKRDYDQSSQPLFYLAKVALKKDNRSAALALLAKARREAPGDPEVLALSHVLTGQAEYSERIERYFDGLDRDFLVGNAFLEAGEAERAVPYFTRLCRRLPLYRRGQIYLAAALAGTGQYEKGAEIYFAALGKRRDPVLLQNEILQGLRRWGDVPPPSARSHFFYGQALRQFGLYAAAMKEQMIARLLSPGHPLVEKEIRFLVELIKRNPSE